METLIDLLKGIVGLVVLLICMIAVATWWTWPRTPDEYLQRGREDLAAGKYESAISKFTRAIQSRPKWAAAHRSRAEAHLKMEQRENAIKDYTVAIGIDEGKATDFLGRAIAYDGPPHASTDHYQIVADCTAAIELDSSLGRAFALRARTYGALNEHAKSEADCDRAIENKIRDAQIYSTRAKARQALKKHDLAIEDRSEAIRLDPDNPIYIYARGNDLFVQGKVAESIADFTATIHLLPLDNIQEKDKRRQAARQSLKKSYQNIKHLAYKMRGKAHLRLEQRQKAIADFGLAIRLQNSDAELYFLRGSSLLDVGDFTACVNDCTEALRIHETHPMELRLCHLVLITRALAHLKLGDKEKALQDEKAAHEYKSKE